jgi:hypothetical protein
MSNANNTEAKAVKEELEQLSKSQDLKEFTERELEEVAQVARDISEPVLKRFKRELEGKSGEDIELFIVSLARDLVVQKRLQDLPNAVARRIATDWRVILSNVASTAVGVGLFALGAAYIPRLFEGAAPNEEIPGTESNPFSETTAAAPARPSKRRDNVVPFDRQAS